MTELPLTLAVCALLVGAAAACGWLGARPLDFSRRGEPRLVPWRGLMLLFAALAIVALVHALNLAGVSTGR